VVLLPGKKKPEPGKLELTGSSKERKKGGDSGGALDKRERVS